MENAITQLITYVNDTLDGYITFARNITPVIYIDLDCIYNDDNGDTQMGEQTLRFPDEGEIWPYDLEALAVTALSLLRPANGVDDEFPPQHN
jgi:hypothetical protein